MLCKALFGCIHGMIPTIPNGWPLHYPLVYLHAIRVVGLHPTIVELKDRPMDLMNANKANMHQLNNDVRT